MKELSIEQKAQRYDEAIARASEMIKAMTNIGGVAKVDDIQYIFPELKESEDERIRKELLTAFSRGHDNSDIYGHGITYRQVRAWLEKQSNKDEEILALKDQIESLHAAIKALKEAHKIELEKQGEQKTAWSEEDEKIINGITSYLCMHDSCELDGFDKWYDFLKSLKDRVHPKQEWSEEDDFMVENVRNSFGLHYGQMTPALQEQYRKFFDKVKAIKLQPNWKPSKEQIKSLYNSIPDAALYEREILTQLYVDLKKLTE